MGSTLLVVLGWLTRNANWYWHERRLGEKQHSLPSGDLGWPLIGNMWSVLRAFQVIRSRLLHVLLHHQSIDHSTNIEENLKCALKKWSDMGRKLTFRIIMYVFLSSASEQVMEALEREYTTINYRVRALAINLPGFAYYNALKARKNLVVIFQSIVDERRKQKEENVPHEKDKMDDLLEAEDENGRRLNDEEIIDILLMYLNAGHESSGHITMWASIFMQEQPEVLKKARVIDETLRLITFSLAVFREVKTDVTINGHTNPKGWKVLVWFRTVQLDPENYHNPKKFDPSRWDNFTPKVGTFLLFGGGSCLYPGNDLAKLQIATFLHYFSLNYRLKRVNPQCPVRYLPHSRPKDNFLEQIRNI